MGKFYVAKDVSLGLVIEVEADNLEDAMAKIDNEWATNTNFFQNYCSEAEVYQNDNSEALPPFDYVLSFEELSQ